MPFRGVLVPVSTPFTPQFAPDSPKFAALCHNLLEQGAAGLAVFGTTSEANSMSADDGIEVAQMIGTAGS